MARRTARDGDWIAWVTCGQVPRILTFRPRCWRFTRNKWCGREFRTFGNTSQSHWKFVLQWRGGRGGGTTAATFSIKHRKEERRGGEEGRIPWAPDHLKK